eukprot:1182468-Prorocentrum_minimum.AAC.2
MDSVDGGLRAWAERCCTEDGAEAAQLGEHLLALANVAGWVSHQHQASARRARALARKMIGGRRARPVIRSYYY